MRCPGCQWNTEPPSPMNPYQPFTSSLKFNIQWFWFWWLIGNSLQQQFLFLSIFTCHWRRSAPLGWCRTRYWKSNIIWNINPTLIYPHRSFFLILSWRAHQPSSLRTWQTIFHCTLKTTRQWNSSPLFLGIFLCLPWQLQWWPGLGQSSKRCHWDSHPLQMSRLDFLERIPWEEPVVTSLLKATDRILTSLSLITILDGVI